MNKIAFAGTFDPVTEGHLWVVEEAMKLADHVIVFVADNSTKSTMFTSKQRVEIFEQALIEKGWNNRVSVHCIKNLYVAKAAKQYGAEYLIRGIRSTVDFDYENLLQQANTEVLHGAKTVFVMPPRDLGAVSSSYVKSLIGPTGWHWYVSKFVPRAAYKALIQKRLEYYWHEHINNSSNFSDLHKIIGMYENSSRVYHNIDHLMHVFDELSACPELNKMYKERVADLYLAAAVHDVVQGTKNEVLESIDWCDQNMHENGFMLSERARDLVKATSHFQTTTENVKDADSVNIMVSIDLAILGQEPERYNIYAHSVKEEYVRMHPDITAEQYRIGRANVLKHFIVKAKNNTLYPTKYYADLYNDAALYNLENELLTLEE